MKAMWVIIAALAIATPPAAQARSPVPAQEARQSQAQGDSLIGLWGAETAFGPPQHGQLTVMRKGEGWHATLAGVETRFSAAGDTVRFTFPGMLGQFRGALTDSGRAIAGFWLQPTGVTEERPDPVGSRQSFATPLILQRTERHAWRGAVRPLEERFTLYLKIYRNPGSLLVGAFRNPEMNSNGAPHYFA